MQPDQAAGLRRRRTAQPGPYLSCFFESPSSVVRLAEAFHDRGLDVLLIDGLGRQFADAPARSLFDWAQQLARGQLHTLPQPYGDGWFAPGVRLDAPGLGEALARWDCVLFDAGPLRDALAFAPHARQTCVVSVDPDIASLQRAYRLLKAVSHADNNATVFLLGEAENCATVLAACRRFLEQDVIRRVNHLAPDDTAFARLAGKMAHEETHHKVRSE